VIELGDIKMLSERANIYLKNISFVFCIEQLPSGRQNYWNGFITDVKTDFIVFFDIKIMREFPIPIDSIYGLEIAKQTNITEVMAREIYYGWRKNNGR
jgi:hypothetical protein